jgi:hypothetical protein
MHAESSKWSTNIIIIRDKVRKYSTESISQTRQQETKLSEKVFPYK